MQSFHMQVITLKQKANFRSSEDFRFNRVAARPDSEPREETCFKITGQLYDFKIENSFKQTKLSKIFKLNSTIENGKAPRMIVIIELNNKRKSRNDG